MVIKNIFYGSDFIKQFKKLPLTIQKLAVKKESLFRKNPIHPSLRLHSLKGKLEGLYSVSITLNYRIIFTRSKTGDIIFVSVGTHDLYKYM
jgi:addiction module RelE/StbE family toxin